MSLSEEQRPADRIEVLEDGNIQVREATFILRDGVRDERFPPRLSRYVLAPGADLTGKHPQIVAVAQAVWTDEVIAAYAAKQAAEA